MKPARKRKPKTKPVRDLDLDTSLRIRAENILGPMEPWAFQCHAASVWLVKHGLGDRVARGTCSGVGGQHSWVVFGDPYHPETIIDPTMWSYNPDVKGVWVGGPGRHRPHGSGSIWSWGRPENAKGEPVELTPRQPWSVEARRFLAMLGPLDEEGWKVMAHAPVGGGWPAAEIIDALCESGMQGYVPIDIIGMLTDRNPAYLP